MAVPPSDPRTPDDLARLPVPLTSFVGRERERDSIESWLCSANVRLLTLTGSGGAGKTRLAIQVAADLAEEFTDGVRFVSLASIRDPCLLVETITAALGVREASGKDHRKRLYRYLEARHLLLVLDNFEQVVEAAPEVGDLLEAAPRLKVMVTSREALRLSAEQEFTVAPFQLPDPRAASDADEVAANVAVQLFVQRARSVKGDFLLSPANVATIAQICIMLDGLPLAIELAAARIKLLPPHEMLERLKRHTSLRLLSGGPRDLPPRQKTLRSAMQWSYDLLTPGERALFRRLAVFVEGCTLEAVESVCAAESTPGLDLLDGVASLIDKSLVARTATDVGEPRFEMLETIREYGLERLQEAGEAEAARCAHAGYYRALAAEGERQLRGGDEGVWLRRLEREHDNLRAALRWSLDRGDARLALQLGGSLWQFWQMRGYLTEGRRWLEEVLAYSEGDESAMRVKALHGAGVLAHYQGDFGRAADLCGRSLALARRLGDAESCALALTGLALVARAGGNFSTALAMYEESLALYRELGDSWGIAHCLLYAGIVSYLGGEWAAARPLLEESLELHRRSGGTQTLAYCTGILGDISRLEGNLPEAQRLIEESLRLSRALGDRRGTARTLFAAANLAVVRGRYAEARARYLESLAILGETGEKWFISAWRAWPRCSGSGEWRPRSWERPTRSGRRWERRGRRL
ncbi:MAG: tetratricopeptide repeat protein [Chloroflexi bacterium]|nr:tetratricopeptide repeat protein [Chloroflexota bacterium]